MKEAERFYLFKIFYNKDVKAEDRPTPGAFNSLEDAEKAMYKYMGDSANTVTCGWVLTVIVDDLGRVLNTNKWSLSESELDLNDESEE